MMALTTILLPSDGSECSGKAAERVVRRAPCPVLSVGPKEHDFVAL